MENMIKELTNNFNLQIDKIISEYNLLTNMLEDKNKTIQLLTEDKNVLKTRINEMLEEKKSKSSSALWESTQIQLKEKDLIIESLKKDIDFYKRNSKNNNVMDKYPYNGNNNKNESENQSNTNILTPKNNINKISNSIVITKEEVKLETVKQEQELQQEEQEEQLEVVELKVKKSKKDKIKDNGEKKKKKKKKEIINLDEDNDIDELEKELAKL
jgi:hypothetical protein